jgi:hypothetical protein
MEGVEEEPPSPFSVKSGLALVRCTPSLKTMELDETRGCHDIIGTGPKQL